MNSDNQCMACAGVCVCVRGGVERGVALVGVNLCESGTLHLTKAVSEPTNR